MNSERFRIPPLTLPQGEAKSLFSLDAELTPILRDPDYKNYRVFISPRIKQKLGAELGFTKSVHNYCCGQYSTDLRIAFGPEASLAALEIARNLLSPDYNVMGWRLYNVKYVIDEFRESPNLLPERNTYERLSDHLIRLRGVSPPFFTDEGKAKLKIRELKSGQAAIEVNSEIKQRVIFSEVNSPGWSVRVDGKPAQIDSAFGYLQAVEVPPGFHQVRFRFSPFQSGRAKFFLIFGIFLWGSFFCFLIWPVTRRLNLLRRFNFCAGDHRLLGHFAGESVKP